MSLCHENRNIDALHKNIGFSQTELTEKNKIIKSLTDTETAALDVMTGLKQPEHLSQNTAEHLSQNNKFNQRSNYYRNKGNQQVGKEKK